jgi:hypothetical protein
MNLRLLCVLCVVVGSGMACGSSQPAAPTPSGSTSNPGGSGSVTLTAAAPTLDSPIADEQLTTLKPTLSVKNGVGSTSAAKTYEFQLSTRSDFTTESGAVSAYYPVTLTKTAVTEGTSTTAFTPEQDLQPATRYYWRARWVQGTSEGEWSATNTFRTQIVGYNRPGELYDPLVNGASVAELLARQAVFIPNKGLRISNSDSYARYKLQQTISNGEFSVDIEGLSASPVSDNPDKGKLKIISMHDNTLDHYQSDYLMNVQYRGPNGNPDNAISFKMLLGQDDEGYKLEPDLGIRRDSVRLLNPSYTYYWKATWGGGFNLQVFDGGAGGVNGSGSGIGGTQIYNYGKSSPYVYAPSNQYAYLGVNNSGSETGSWPMAIYRNVWIANKGRPVSLGSAMTKVQ